MKREHLKLIFICLICFSLFLLAFFLFDKEDNTSDTIKKSPRNIRLQETAYEIPEFRGKEVLEADSVLLMEDFILAEKLFLSLKAKFSNDNNFPGLIYSLNKLGSLNIDLYNMDRAYQFLLTADSLGKIYLSEKNSLRGDTYFLLGKYFDFNKEPDKSIAYHTKGLDQRNKIFGENSRQVAESYEGLGNMYLYTLKDYINAEKFLLKALKIKERFKDISKLELLKTYYSTSSSSRLNGDYNTALMYANESLILSESLPNDVPKGKSYFMGLCANLIGNIYHEFDEPDKAKINYLDAIRKLESDPLNIDLLGTFYNNLGRIYLNLNEYKNAEIYLKKALKIFESSSHKFKEEITSCYSNLALLYSDKNDFESSLKFYHKSLNDRLKTNPYSYPVASNYINLGDLYRKNNDFRKALENYQLALHSLAKSVSKDNLYALPEVTSNSSNHLLELVIKKANAFKELYENESHNLADLDASLQHFILADRLNNYSKTSLNPEDSKLFLEKYYHADFQKAVEVAYNLYNLTHHKKYIGAAFTLIEKRKYILLFESVTQADRINKSPIPKEIIEKENELKTSIAFYSHQIEVEELKENPDREKIKKLKQKEFELSRKQTLMHEEIIGNYPNYSDIKYEKLNFRLSEIERLLKKNKMIVEYYWTDNNVYILTISKNQTSIFSIKADSLSKMVENYRNVLHSSPTITQVAFDDFENNAFSIYKKLVHPLNIPKATDEIIIIPDGPLELMPFEALITKKSDQKTIDYKNLDYLIKDLNISYAYSSNILKKNLNKKAHSFEGKLLAFGYQSKVRSAESNQEDLLGTERELEYISSKVSGDYLTGDEATEDNFKQKSFDYDIIHLALHGIADNSSSINSKLIFRKGNSKTKEDGFLYSYELLNMKLNTQLVVLSACETALGKQKIGEGVYSIARGFALTGCPSIVMSFWKVNDKTTSEIMGSFYHNLSQGKKINAALRNSKIDYLEEADEISAHPANWAAFVCLGNVSAVNLPVNNYYKWYYLAGFLFLCITCFFAVKYFMFQARKQVIHHGLESI